MGKTELLLTIVIFNVFFAMFIVAVMIYIRKYKQRKIEYLNEIQLKNEIHQKELLATHEVGHYLNLRHIWGDANCGTDYVTDTPTQTTANVGKPSYPLYNTCSGVSRSVMFMNYMDYVDDSAMFMFSSGQKTRMQSVVSSSGSRSGLRVY